MAYRYRRVGIIQGIVDWISGSSYSSNKATQVVENYVKNNLNVEAVTNYLDRLASTVKVDTQTIQNIRNIYTFDKSKVGDLNVAQKTNIKATVKNMVNSTNAPQVSNALVTGMDESLRGFQDKLTSDFGALFTGGKGQEMINNLVNDVRKRMESNFSTDNVVNTFTSLSSDQNAENIVNARESEIGNINFSQEAAADIVVGTVLEMVSKQLLDNRAYTDITKAIINDQHKKDTGLDIGKTAQTAIETGSKVAENWFSTWKWVIIAAAIVLAILIIGIIIFLLMGGLSQATEFTTALTKAMPSMISM